MNAIKISIVSCTIAMAAIFSGCNKEDNQAQPKTQSISQSQESLGYVPFFELAKGDTIPKGIFREKPNTNAQANIVVLYSSENKLKAVGNSTGSGYILDLQTSVRSSNDAPATMSGYTKIPVDLNEGAGGKYIYLYYNKTTSIATSLCYLNVRTSCCTPFLFPSYEYMRRQGVSFGSSGWTDLNQGAGGNFIVLEGCSAENIGGWILYCTRNNLPIGPVPSDNSPIRDILLISSSKGLGSYSGWNLIPTDLNKGAGGKYIYLCYKK
jgi:hypothetical protein